MSESTQDIEPAVFADVERLMRELRVLGKLCKPLKKTTQDVESPDGNSIVVKGR
ncbi:MAG: hypothetical protein ACI9G1_000724 [Pirellulaceae bacterium]|jgi:hypothetical protein